MALWNSVLELTMGVTVPGMIIHLCPVWVAFLLGLLLGWIWKSRWSALDHCKSDVSVTSSPSTSVNVRNDVIEKESATSSRTHTATSSSSQVKNGEPVVVKEDDLDHFCRLVKKKDGGPPWKHVMERSTSDMNYQAWQRDPQTGPPQYCSRTVYENATPELLRDFYWDDEFRLKWDNMLVHAQTMEECPNTGTMIVHWIRKFPFFCSNREYIIGRRIWESGRSYYCVTKGVPYDSIPRKDKPRRVDLFYSSWFIQAVESKKDNGQLTACEVILYHHEEMGIPWEIAKFGVRQGMWGTVRNIERGFEAYKSRERTPGVPISHYAFMAQINSKIDPNYIKAIENGEVPSETGVVCSPEPPPSGINIPKILVIGGALVVACSVDQGLLTKTVIFSIARTFANIGRLGRPGRR